MSLHTRLSRTLTDPQLRLATIIGLASVPITVALSWETVLDERTVAGGTISGVPLLIVGLLMGYLYYERPADRRSVGVAAGIAASTGLVVVDLAKMISTFDAFSRETLALALIGTPIISPSVSLL
jgi:peptidoglycan/LPS O-acetylase OafA/YrhL